MLAILFHLLLSAIAYHHGDAPAAYAQAGEVRGANVIASTRLPAVKDRIRIVLPAADSVPSVSAQAVSIWDTATQTFLYEKSADAVRPLASVTKLMTALLVVEQGIDMNTVITIEADDNDPEGARLNVSSGAQVTVQDLFYATMVGSENNAAEALVRATGVAEAEFVRRMNARAEELGMRATRFTDVTGLGASNESTARDLTLLARATFSHEEIRQASTSSRYAITDQRSGKTIRIANTNGLLGTTLRVIAGKTGYTSAAGGNFVSQIRGNGEHELIFVLLGSDNQETRLQETWQLADWIFGNTVWK